MGTTTSRYTPKNDDGTSPSKKQHRFAASNSRRRREASKTTSSSTAATKAVTKAKKMTKNSSPALKDSTTQQATLLLGGAGDVATTQQNGRIPLESVARSNDAAEGESAKEKSYSRGDGVENEVNKTPIDPPGALWSQQPAFQPVWGPPAPSVGGNGRSSWAMAMPPFLAPIAATVRHPFSHFSGPNGHGHFPYWQQQQQQQQQYYHDCEERSDDIGTPMEAEMEANAKAGSVDTTMKEEVVTLPSTFAPQEYVDRIRAKAKVNAGQEVNVVQTRSMTAKSRGSTKKVSPTVTVAAHQASSPPSSSKNKGKNLLTKKKTTKMIGDDINDMNPTPEVMTILGKRVTMIDPDRKVFVIDLLSPETCDEIRMMADNHTRTVKEGAETWRTLYTYTKMDLPVVEVDGMVSKYTDKILHDVKKIVGVVFGMRREAMRLRPRSWKEPHLLLYQALDERPHHTGIEMHYDGCDVTWQAMLTRLDEYEGGGTYFRCLRKTIKLEQGQVLVHPGELYHKGIDITYGVRCLLVCFTDGMNPKILDDSKAEDDDESYEKNVIIC